MMESQNQASWALWRLAFRAVQVVFLVCVQPPDAEAEWRERLLIRGVEVSAPSWSPDGSSIVHDSRADLSIVVVEIQNGRVSKVESGAMLNNPTWSPSEVIAYIDKSRDPREIVLRDPTSDSRRIVAGSLAELGERPWSGTGHALVFRDGDELRLLDVDSGRVTVVSTAHGQDSVRFQRLAPDGLTIVGTSRAGIVQISVESGKAELLAERGRFPFDVGERGRLIFADSVERERLVLREPGVEDRIFHLRGTAGCVSFSPERNRVAVCVRGEGIQLIDLTTGATVKASSGYRDGAISWSPDGSSIAFVRMLDGGTASLFVASDESVKER